MTRVISLEDFYITFKFFITILSINTMSAWFSDCFFIWLGNYKPYIVINILFVWSQIYQMNKVLIDSVCDNFAETFLEDYQLVKAMIPKYEAKTQHN